MQQLKVSSLDACEILYNSDRKLLLSSKFPVLAYSTLSLVYTTHVDVRIRSNGTCWFLLQHSHIQQRRTQRCVLIELSSIRTYVSRLFDHGRPM